MTLKNRVAALLEQRQGNYMSGSEIAEELGVTRAAVWKAVKSLQDNGYNIKAITNKGYCLSADADILSENGILNHLKKRNQLKLEVLNEVGSTNALLRERANDGADEGYIIIAGSQTKGRGRFSRSFFSPKDSGIYMSILLKPEMAAAEATLITTAAAVAVSDATEKVSGHTTGIKWVNDVLIDSKKICGILTEASLNVETGSLDYAILGIGINAYTPDNGFPEEIKDIAGSVFDTKKADQRNWLAAEIINCFFTYYNELREKTYLNTYRQRCIVFGKKINVIKNGSITPATALDIDDDCRLLVKYEDGSQDYLSSGEISIRLQK